MCVCHKTVNYPACRDSLALKVLAEWNRKWHVIDSNGGCVIRCGGIPIEDGPALDDRNGIAAVESSIEGVGNNFIRRNGVVISAQRLDNRGAVVDAVCHLVVVLCLTAAVQEGKCHLVCLQSALLLL